MKKYENPIIEIEKFEIFDVITASNEEQIPDCGVETELVE